MNDQVHVREYHVCVSVRVCHCLRQLGIWVSFGHLNLEKYDITPMALYMVIVLYFILSKYMLMVVI